MKKFIAYLGFATLITLYGCSSPEAPAPDPVEQVAESAPAKTVESTPTETVDPAEPTNNEVVTGDNPIHVGDTFEFVITNMAGETTPWHVTITDVETVTELPEIGASPQAGNEFIHATYETTNITKRPNSIMLSAGVAYADGTLMAPQDADTYSMDLTNLREDDAGAEQNPNTTHTGDFVIEVPQGAEVTHLVVDSFPGGSGEYWVEI